MSKITFLTHDLSVLRTYNEPRKILLITVYMIWTE